MKTDDNIKSKFDVVTAHDSGKNKTFTYTIMHETQK